MMEALLTSSIPTIGNVTITRENYIYCACENAFTWTITFNDYTAGFIPLITFDTTLITSISGGDAGLVGPIIIQKPAHMNGTFLLEITTANGFQQSGALPYNASG
jgi:hypothetical protein